jgi:hypothetical protein
MFYSIFSLIIFMVASYIYIRGGDIIPPLLTSTLDGELKLHAPYALPPGKEHPAPIG